MKGSMDLIKKKGRRKMIDSVSRNYVQQNVAFKSNENKANVNYEKTNKGKIIGSAIGLGTTAAVAAYAKRHGSLLLKRSNLNRLLTIQGILITLTGFAVGGLIDRFSNKAAKKIAQAKAEVR